MCRTTGAQPRRVSRGKYRGCTQRSGQGAQVQFRQARPRRGAMRQAPRAAYRDRDHVQGCRRIVPSQRRHTSRPHEGQRRVAVVATQTVHRRPLAVIKASEVLKVLEGISATGKREAARRGGQFVGRVFRHAINRDWYVGVNPTANLRGGQHASSVCGYPACCPNKYFVSPVGICSPRDFAKSKTSCPPSSRPRTNASSCIDAMH
jgi:hypothetical protein